MPATNNAAAQTASGEPQVNWPKPPVSPPPPRPALVAIAISVVLIAVLCILMTIKLFDISNQLKTLNNGNQSGTGRSATINRTP